MILRPSVHQECRAPVPGLHASCVSPFQGAPLKASRKGEHGSCIHLRGTLLELSSAASSATRATLACAAPRWRSVLLLGLVAIWGVLSLGLGVFDTPIAAKVGEEGAAAVVSGGRRVASRPVLGVPGGDSRAHGVYRHAHVSVHRPAQQQVTSADLRDLYLGKGNVSPHPYQHPPSRRLHLKKGCRATHHAAMTYWHMTSQVLSARVSHNIQ